MATSSHAWATGHSVALASLSNISDLLYGRNRQTALSPRRPVAVQTEITDEFPSSKQTLDGATSGAGFPQLLLTVTLFASSFSYIVTTYFTSGGNVLRSAPFTLYYPRLELGTSDRVNCYITKSSGPSESDYLRNNLVRVTFPVTVIAVL